MTAGGGTPSTLRGVVVLVIVDTRRKRLLAGRVGRGYPRAEGTPSSLRWSRPHRPSWSQWSSPSSSSWVAAVVDNGVLSVPSSVVGINDDRVVLTVIQVVDGVGYDEITNQTTSSTPTARGYAAT